LPSEKAAERSEQAQCRKLSNKDFAFSPLSFVL
jgi:hypothetical protein